MKGVLAFTLAALLHAPLVEGAGLTLDIRDGKVMLDAQDVTIGQILTEWARVGGTLITNVERLSSAPVRLRLEAVPEREALEIILRSAAGYLAAPRPVAVAGRSIQSHPDSPGEHGGATATTFAGHPFGTASFRGQHSGNDAPAGSRRWERADATPGVTAPAPGRPPGYVPPGYAPPGFVVPPQGGPNQPGVPRGLFPGRSRPESQSLAWPPTPSQRRVPRIRGMCPAAP